MEKKIKKRRNPLLGVFLEEWKYLGNRKKIFIFYLFLYLIAGTIALMTPLVIGLIFNTVQESITSKVELTRLLFLISLLLIIDVGFWIFHGWGRVLEQRTGFFVYKNFINSKINKVLELPVKWHKDHPSGDTIDKINRAGDGLFDYSKHFTFSIVYAVLNIFGSLIILFFVDIKIAAFALVYSLSTIFVIMKFDKKLVKHYKQLNRRWNKLAASVFDYISNIFTVITLKLKRTVSQEIDNKIMDAYEIHKKSTILSELKWAFATIAISIMTVLVLIYKSYTDYMATGVILVGTLYILYGYLEKVGKTFFSFAQLYGTVVSYDARLIGVSEIDEAFNEVKEELKGNLPKDWNELEIRNLNFKYEEKINKRHLDEVNIKIKRGQKIALIGESGSGKSTILSVLRGLHPPQEGKVIYKGKELNYGFARLKHNITLIPQDPEIFNNTIKFNITMDLKPNREDLKKSIQMAQFGKVLRRLENGIDTSVMEKGVSLSGGEKQRLALARGLLAARSSDIILMDEPTSSVDSINEVKIHQNIFKEFKDKTIISSIHRLHLLNKFDYIYMFENGKIAIEGTFEDMMKNPKFLRMWRKHGGKK
jgi:ABC-type multidrug transport system fused ATPase/permease subunit